jgi:hypothetical protein
MCPARIARVGPGFFSSKVVRRPAAINLDLLRRPGQECASVGIDDGEISQGRMGS